MVAIIKVYQHKALVIREQNKKEAVKMRITSKLSLAIFLSLLLSCVSLVTSYATVPHLINYQGRLTDSSGVPLNGTYELTFRIYDAESAGNLLWQETHSAVLIQKGIFSIMLGSVTSMDLPFDKAYFLEIKVGNEVMSPRQRITSAGYAIKAEEAEKLGGKQPSDYALASDITSVPTANKVVKLDANAKLPVAALKVYDSGWFAVTSNTTYSKTHNLGTTKCMINIHTSNSSDGSANCVDNIASYDAGHTEYADFRGVNMCTLTTTVIKVRANNLTNYYQAKDENGNTINIAYARIIMLALE